MNYVQTRTIACKDKAMLRNMYKWDSLGHSVYTVSYLIFYGSSIAWRSYGAKHMMMDHRFLNGPGVLY
jgi:hypothetical protein